MKNLKIGYVALSKASWLTPKIDRIATNTFEQLKKLPDTEIIYHGVTTTEAEGTNRAEELAARRVDAVVMHFVTFPVGAIIPAVAQRLNVPFILLANPEQPSMTKIWEQNSFCGANMAAYIMNRLHKQYCYVMASPDEAIEKLRTPLAAIRALRMLKDLRVGHVGGRVPGFYTSNFDELQLRREFGVTVEVLELLEIVKTAEQLDAGLLEEAWNVVKNSAAKVNCVSNNDLELAARMYGAFRVVAEKYNLSTFAIRCWPEFSDLFGIAPCAVLGMLSDTGYTASCEGDMTGAVTMKLLEYLAGGGIAFFVDLISTDIKTNTGVVWHCGAAPKSLCCKFEETELRLHMRVDGGDKKGITNDFSLKEGCVTLAKLDTDADGKLRMLIAPGTAINTEPFIRGNPLTIRFDGPVPKLINTIMKKGFEHHYAVIHANVTAELVQFCEWLNIETILVNK